MNKTPARINKSKRREGRSPRHTVGTSQRNSHAITFWLIIRLRRAYAYVMRYLTQQRNFLLVSGLVVTTAIMGVLTLQQGKVGTASTSTMAPQAVVLVFDGKPISANQIDARQYSVIRTLTLASQYADLQRRSFDSALWQALDQIEVDKVTDQELTQHPNLSREQAIDAVINRMAPMHDVNDHDTRQFYQKHPELFARSSPTMHVREIAVADINLADQVHTRLLSHEPFEQLARKYSLDPVQYKQQGGDVGWVVAR